jgi:hypothetical protein
MKKIVYILFFLLIVSVCKGQSDSSYVTKYSKGIIYEVLTDTKIKYTGFIVEEKSYGITLKNPKSNIKTYLYNSEIISVVPVENERKSRKNFEPYEENKHSESYMLAGSSFLFEPGKVVSTYHWGFVDNITFPINENWAITANSIFIYPYSLGFKSAYKLSENNYIGGGAFGMINIGSKNSNDLFLGYCAKANFTHGTSNNNFTLSGGVLGLNSNLFNTTISNDPFLNLYFGNFSYCNRFSRLFAFNAEAWYFPESQSGFAGLGLKLVRDNTSSWTFGCYGLLNNLSNGIKIDVKTVPIPYIGYSQNF